MKACGPFSTSSDSLTLQKAVKTAGLLPDWLLLLLVHEHKCTTLLLVKSHRIIAKNGVKLGNIQMFLNSTYSKS